MSLLSVADFQGKKLKPHMSPFEILLEVVAVAAQMYDTINNHNVDEGVAVMDEDDASGEKEQDNICIYDHENSEPNVVATSSSRRARTPKKEEVLKQPMRKCKVTRKRCNNGEPKLMGSAIKALSKIIQNNDDGTVKTQSDELELEGRTDEKDLITGKAMKKKKERQGTQKLKNSAADDESSPEPGTNKGKRKMEDMSNEEWIKTMKNKKKKKGKGTNPAPSLPEEFQREIVKKSGVTGAGQMATLIIQKRLEKTDLSKNHGRISIPCSQVETFEFLRDQEMMRLRREGTITVQLIHKPKKNGVTLPLTETPIEMRQWNLHKFKGDPDKVSPQYLLRTAWNRIVLEDELKRGDVIQIWAFRNAQDKLSMALVKVDD